MARLWRLVVAVVLVALAVSLPSFALAWSYARSPGGDGLWDLFLLFATGPFSEYRAYTVVEWRNASGCFWTAALMILAIFLVSGRRAPSKGIGWLIVFLWWVVGTLPKLGG